MSDPVPPEPFSSAAPLPPDSTNDGVRTSSTPTSLPTRGKDPWAETTTDGPTPLSRSAKGRLKKAGSFRERKNPTMGNLRIVGSEGEPGQKSQGSAWSSEANGAAQTSSSSSIKDMIAREAAIERGAVDAARHSATITQEEVEAMQRVFERAAVANEVQLVSAAMNQSATHWWRERSSPKCTRAQQLNSLRCISSIVKRSSLRPQSTKVIACGCCRRSQ